MIVCFLYIKEKGFIMPTNSDHNDFYIRSNSHPVFEENKLVVEEMINVIIQKLEMLIYSNKGDLYGDANFGSDLEYYLWETSVPSYEIKKKMFNQISTYIPELITIGYSLVIDIYEGKLKDIMYLRFKINEYNMNFIID